MFPVDPSTKGGTVMRTFVAVEVPTLHPPRGLSFELATAPHLTLRFLGDVSEAEIERIRPELKAGCSEVGPFSFVLQGVGAFPSTERPRVIFVDVTMGRGELIELAAVIERALARSGVPPETRPFVPHVTLMRVRSRRDRDRASELLGLPAGEVWATAEVHEAILYSSTLTASGAIHDPVDRFPLTGSAVARH